MIEHQVVRCLKPDPRDKGGSQTAPKYVLLDFNADFSKTGHYNEIDHTTKE